MTGNLSHAIWMCKTDTQTKSESILTILEEFRELNYLNVSVFAVVWFSGQSWNFNTIQTTYFSMSDWKISKIG